MNRQYKNRLDERQRFMGLETHLFPEVTIPQLDSHGISYLGARRMYEEMGMEMGLGKEEVYVPENSTDITRFYRKAV